LLFAAAAGFAQRSPRRGVKTTGTGLLVVVAFIALALAKGLVNWGILKSSESFDVYQRSSTYALLTVMNMVLIFAWCIARRWRPRDIPTS
jgi:hypothetical protein